MTEFETAYTVEYPLDSLEVCVFLFGEKSGAELWEALQKPIENPRHSCMITGIDEPTNTIYFGPPND